MEHNVDIPVSGGGGRPGRKRRTHLWPKLERRLGQGSTASHGAEEEESEEEFHDVEYFVYHGRLWASAWIGLAGIQDWPHLLVAAVASTARRTRILRSSVSPFGVLITLNGEVRTVVGFLL